MGNISVWGSIMYMLPNLMGIFTTQEPTPMDSITGMIIPFSGIALENSVNILKKKRINMTYVTSPTLVSTILLMRVTRNTSLKYIQKALWLGCNFIFMALIANIAGTQHSPECPSSLLPQTKSSCNRAAVTVCFAESAE